MEISYKTTTSGNSLRTIHVIVIGDEFVATTRVKEVLLFAKPRLSKHDYKDLKEAVRLGTTLEMKGGN